MSLVQREQYLLSIIKDSPGKVELGNRVKFISGAHLLGASPKTDQVRVHVILAGGSSNDNGYVDRTNLFSFGLICHSLDRTLLLEIVDILLTRLDSYNLSWSIREEEYSNLINSLTLTVS